MQIFCSLSISPSCLDCCSPTFQLFASLSSSHVLSAIICALSIASIQFISTIFAFLLQPKIPPFKPLFVIRIFSPFPTVVIF